VKKIRIGVYVCHCGLNIAGVVDVAAVRDYAKTLPGVVVARDNRYACSEVGQRAIAQDIKRHKLERVVVASCTPRLHESTFQRVLGENGLNPYLIEMANIRDQCSWVHYDQPEKATQKAKDLVRAAVARARLLRPLEVNTSPVNKSAMVIGAGIAGISAALYLGKAGIKTYLVEKGPSIGGHMAMLDKTFPTLDCSLCILSPLMVDVAQNENIKLLTCTEMTDVTGFAGNFKVKLRKKPRYVDEDKCVACGLCAEKCPTKVPDEFNRGLTMRKAIYIPFAQAIPSKYLIDPERCLYFTKERCKVCQRVCEAGALNFDQKEEEVEIDIGVIIITTGFDVYDPSENREYGYGRYPNVLTQLDFERMLSADGPTHGKLKRLSDGKPIKRLAFIQCVGSRNLGNAKYCSRVCCMITTKQAVMVKEKNSEVEVYVYYIDMRTAGKEFEEFYQRARSSGVVFVRGRPGEIVEHLQTHNLRIIAEDADSGCLFENEVDMVILAVGLKPAKDVQDLTKKLRLSRSADGFLLEAHPKLRPAETTMDGVYLAGCAQFPKDIPDTVAQAGNAAAVAAGLLSRDVIEIVPLNAVVNADNCIGCGLCESLCPYGAIRLEKTAQGPKAGVTETLCKGCGVCAASCPERAIAIQHYADEQIIAQIQALLGVR